MIRVFDARMSVALPEQTATIAAEMQYFCVLFAKSEKPKNPKYERFILISELLLGSSPACTMKNVFPVNVAIVFISCSFLLFLFL